MTDRIANFFAAWGETDAATRRASVADCMAPEFTYSDPMTDGPITSLDALCDYLGAFATHAPGWTAKALTIDEKDGFARILVGFGADGTWSQHGTYFALERDSGIVTMTGFKGAGGLPQ
ncbi:nuclear transport factor 2 family protein [Loktanella sp. SALINAS62]|uniref:nuclear transport factor 2 family protein n=1 Tax=Loktanella sp. SALINAS62 TaxID=2706124 RepID=UPI001B8D6B08|nr:nuclear transport factor 2 family protein [Loktanella sp. SALINAS62]MBS1301332.1 nuclear transport factor 2 family protein [Loktanella sp. SALINAS62]